MDLWGEVGIAAGQVYSVLAENEKEMTMTSVKKEAGLNEPMLSMACGWLLREEKLVISKNGKSITLKLK